MSAFAFHEIRKSYTGHAGAPVHALRGLTFEAPSGGFMVLLGSSGSGKTTALRILAGLETPDSGELTIGGRSGRGFAARDRDAAMVFQHPALYPHLTVEANIRLGLEIRRIPSDEIRRRTAAAVELMDVGGFLNRLPATLSGGQMQRVALARAMARRPALMLLDEPLASLDGPSRGALKERIREMQAATGTTTVLVTHDQAEAFSLGQQIAVLEDGRTLQTGTPRELYFRPENLAVARFLSKPRLNTLAGKFVRNGAGVCFEAAGLSGQAGAKILLPPCLWEVLSGWEGRPLILAVRPENIEASSGSPVNESSRIHFTASVQRTELLCGMEDLHLRIAGNGWVARGTRFKAEQGARIELFVNGDSLLFFDPESEKRIE